eukprot:315963_1
MAQQVYRRYEGKTLINGPTNQVHVVPADVSNSMCNLCDGELGLQADNELLEDSLLHSKPISKITKSIEGNSTKTPPTGSSGSWAKRSITTRTSSEKGNILDYFAQYEDESVVKLKNAEAEKEVDAIKQSKDVGLYTRLIMVAKEKKFTFDEEVEETNFYMNATLKVISSTGRHIFRELATLKVPPLAVRDVLSGVMLLLGEEKVNWTTMKKWMRE